MPTLSNEVLASVHNARACNSGLEVAAKPGLKAVDASLPGAAERLTHVSHQQRGHFVHISADGYSNVGRLGYHVGLGS